MRWAALLGAIAFVLTDHLVHAQTRIIDELLLRPKRLTAQGRSEYARGNPSAAQAAFESAQKARPKEPRTQFNLADALYQGGRYDEAEALYRALGGDARSELAQGARFNLGNTLYQKKDFPGAIGAYRDALRLNPADTDAKRNLELAWLALKQQQQQKQQQQKDQNQKKDQRSQAQSQPQSVPRPKSADEKERERYERETGMPKERAMQILNALQQNEKDEQKRLLAARRVEKKPGRDW
jgi:tetratricopeptide (TPR) repeat protein